MRINNYFWFMWGILATSLGLVCISLISQENFGNLSKFQIFTLGLTLGGALLYGIAGIQASIEKE